MRAWILLSVALWSCPVLIVGGIGAGLPIAAAVGAGLGAAIALGFACTPGLSRTLAPALAPHFVLRIALGLLTVLAIVRIAWLSFFMADVRMAEHSLKAEDPFRTRHSCMTSYAEAARFLAEGGHNLYELTLYEPRQLGPLKVDPYHYPPPFLLVPQVVHAFTGDFWRFRAVWFMFQAVVLAGALLLVTVWLGGLAGAIALTGGVLLLTLPGVLYGLQQGNFQVTAAPMAVVAVMLLNGPRLRAGALLLAYAAAAKIFPGILIVYLAAARRWRALAWTAGCGLLLLALTLMTQGPRPMVDFVSHALPEMSSGAAFPHTERPPTASMNWTTYGVTVRLRLLGVTALDQRTGLQIASVYGLMVIVFAAWAGWRSRLTLDDERHRVALLQVALGLVALASFRSPFAGAPYGSMSTLWLMSLLAAGASTGTRASLWLGALFALGVGIWSLPSPAHAPTPFTLVVSGLLFLITLGVSAWAVWHGAISPPALHPADRPRAPVPLV